MIALIQRVNYAAVRIATDVVASIDHGILAFVAVELHDTPVTIEKMMNKLLDYRIFSDAEGKMNCALRDLSGAILLVPQFTLMANTRKGNRPSFTGNVDPHLGRILFEHGCCYLTQHYEGIVATGVFGADMKVSLENDGPVTFLLRI